MPGVTESRATKRVRRQWAGKHGRSPANRELAWRVASELTDRVTLGTGASSDIGETTAKALTARREDEPTELAAEGSENEDANGA